MELRKSVVAGYFYTSNKKELEQELRGFIKSSVLFNNVLSAIAPHAGYIYSGATTGKVYASLNVPDIVFILCPNHTGLGYPISLDPNEEWETPLGNIKTEQILLDKIKSRLPQAEFDKGAQKKEHALEVQLPFIQYCNPKARIVPITLAQVPLPIIKELGKIISDLIIEEEKNSGIRPLVIASSDMTHFESAEQAKTKDMLAIEQIKKLDTKGFIDTINKNKISICGLYPIATMIEIINNYSKAKNIPAKVELIEYTNSGELTGNTREVVAYAGLVIHD